MTTDLPPLAAALRALRADAAMSGVSAAKAAGISQAKLSNIERGKTPPTPADAERLAEVYGASVKTRDRLVEQAREAKAQAWSAKVVLQRGGWLLQDRIGRQESSAGSIRYFCPSGVIGLLQTPGYVRAMWGDEMPAENVDKFVESRMRRQQILGSDQREIVAIHTEGALRWNLGGPDVMVEQLDRLLDELDRPHLRQGIIPWTTPVGWPALHQFTIYDDTAALVSTVPGTSLVTDAENVQQVVREWEHLERYVAWGENARPHLERIRAEYAAL
ncbi:hypothetical protein GCM10027059_03540 [Myceligenerans halotolerans]